MTSNEATYKTIKDSPNVPEFSSIRSGRMNRLLKLDISDLNPQKTDRLKNQLMQLQRFAELSHVQIHFINLKAYNNKHELQYLCNLDSINTNHLERDIGRLMQFIQAKSHPSARKYEIELQF